MEKHDDYLQALLSRLDGRGEPAAAETAGAVAVAPAGPSSSPRVEGGLDDRIESLRKRLTAAQAATARGESVPTAVAPSPLVAVVARAPAIREEAPVAKPAASVGAFVPPVTDSLASSRLTEFEVQSLILKYLGIQLAAAGRQIAEQLRLPFGWLERILSQLKIDQLVVHKASAAMGDHVYQLTAAGVADARHRAAQCSYCGAAPVSLPDYVDSVAAQSVVAQQPTYEDLDGVFTDLLVTAETRNQIGQAIHSGHGFFLYGKPGNGKTSIAERVSRAYGPTVWIPRAISIDGEIVRLYDPCQHIEMPIDATAENLDPRQIDQRWIRIRRPTIVAGGELTLDQLEIAVNRATGINEAPLQLKSNCGTLVIDDFGRQRMNIAELLNRWIVPLDKRHDYLHLPSGKTVQVPFDQLLVFSTNIEPKDLVDEAFLRRIPYKIEVLDPSETEFRDLFRLYCQRLGFTYSDEAVDGLIQRHYAGRRAFRYCHPRDLLLQVRSYCRFNKRPLVLSAESLDVAVRNYFAVMG